MSGDSVNRVRSTQPGEEHYSAGYDSVLTKTVHSSRSAEIQAAWFLPHLVSGMKLLDCGCGSGSITVGLAAAVAPGRVTGIDGSELELGRARDRAAAEERANVEFRAGNIYHLDLADNTFDAVFSHNALEHLHSPIGALQEMYRVLKPGGILGVRDVDWTGNLLAPDDEILRKYVAIYGTH